MTKIFKGKKTISEENCCGKKVIRINRKKIEYKRVVKKRK